MIRPEAAARLRRWREVLIGAGALVLGLWLLLQGRGLALLFGLALLASGAGLLLTGIRRARFRTEAEAPGIVEAVEGRIAYMGPVMGGTVGLDELQEVAFQRRADGSGFWRLMPAANAPLFIPEGALGADILLDALAPLPGMEADAMVRAVQAHAEGFTIVWRRAGVAALT
ncbi:MAG: hypothetical protein AAF919_13640 [Pseudomonadota bacterium]